MSMLILAVLIAGMMPLACAAIAKWGFKGYDNRNPRAWLANLEGYRARANAAQLNSLEAFPFFAAGVALALLSGVEPGKLLSVAWFFVVIRLLYIACYLSDKASWRSLCWMLGYASVICLYVMAL
jgi:uncharacterized MAPEG superfamily protein